MRSIDLNADIGESFGVYRLADDEPLLPFVSSVNIACGFHAGDPATMRRTVKLALAHGVAIGAHPGLPDLVGFGRRAMQISAEEAYDLLVYQIGALAAFVQAAGGKLQHVKPHGALYNMAAKDGALARAIATAIADIDRRLVLFGLSGSELIAAGKQAGLATAAEAFADRSYESDGTLTPRSRPGAVIEDSAAAAARALRMARDGEVVAADEKIIRLEVGTICIHGDSSNAIETARAVRQALNAAGIAVKPPEGYRSATSV
jgi:UPF0271 protein